MAKSIGIFFLALLGLAILLWSRTARDHSKFMPAGDVRSDHGFYSVVFYFAPDPAADTLATAQALAKRFLPAATFTTDGKNPPEPPFLGFDEEQAPLEKFPVPEAADLKREGFGLDEKDIAAFQKTTRATRLILSAPKDEVWSLGRKFTEMVHEFAVTTGAVIWDSATRQCFGRDAWKEKRLSLWPEDGIPELNRQITIHLYPPEEGSRYLRAITLGMEKFALPDVVIERLVGSNNRPSGNLINLVCQSIAERPVLRSGVKEIFRLDQLKAEAMRTGMEGSLKKGATGEVPLGLLNGLLQEGDCDNRLIEIDFRHGSGDTEDERRADLLSKLWGASDSIAAVTHSEEILEASRRARSHLGELRAAFEKGLPPGSSLLVKAPFARDDEGKEWMWVEVLRWPAGDPIEGILQNDPFYIQGLKAGSKVQVKEADVFDYILSHWDGTEEGNETGKLMEQQGGPSKEK